MDATPVSLLVRLRQPADQPAWTRFVDLYTPLLFHWARRTGMQEPDAADLVQDVFQALLRKLPQFTYDQNRSFRGWLRTVMLNQWRTGRRRRTEQPLDENDPGSAAVGLALLFLGLIAAAAVVFRVQTESGEVVIEANDPDVEVVMKRSGKEVFIVDPRSKLRWQLDTEKF